jgi:hypothetical protein
MDAFLCLKFLPELRTLFLHNYDADSLIKSTILDLLEQGYLPHLQILGIYAEHFKLRRCGDTLDFVPTDVPRQNRRWMYTQ